LQANVEGIGPMFKIKLSLENMSKIPAIDMRISFSYDQRLYHIFNTQAKIPFLVPGGAIIKNINLLSIDENGVNDIIKIFIYQPTKQKPLTGAIISMPISEIDVV